MDELVNRAKNLFTMREYGIITTHEYIEELNKIRKSLGFENFPCPKLPPNKAWSRYECTECGDRLPSHFAGCSCFPD